MQSRPSLPVGFNQQVQKPSQVESSKSLENLLKTYMAKNDAIIQSQATTLKNLENQMGQLASALPSDTENLRNLGKEHCKAVSLRIRKTLEPSVVKIEDDPTEA
ncbi:serine/threonine-protein kinase atg1-like [Gossypium australe]|uniref:Serine/threonine-protein kinase atg1-like n=1 Tax=Gossypium australe TaxID=47621 RepID=A0A5B6VB12_9ROSI|nr:serine/threonine-protein kinase atg1-like [Gossypium australe]